MAVNWSQDNYTAIGILLLLAAGCFLLLWSATAFCAKAATLYLLIPLVTIAVVLFATHCARGVTGSKTESLAVRREIMAELVAHQEIVDQRSPGTPEADDPVGVGQRHLQRPARLEGH
jgi:hypothetical protein